MGAETCSLVRTRTLSSARAFSFVFCRGAAGAAVGCARAGRAQTRRQPGHEDPAGNRCARLPNICSHPRLVIARRPCPLPHARKCLLRSCGETLQGGRPPTSPRFPSFLCQHSPPLAALTTQPTALHCFSPLPPDSSPLCAPAPLGTQARRSLPPSCGETSPRWRGTAARPPAARARRSSCWA